MFDTGNYFSKMVKEISSDISEKIRGLSPTLNCKPTTPTITTIFRADSRFEQKYYEPKLVSIGPYHHGKDHLQKMEQEKLRCLKTLVARQKSSVDEYVDTMMSVEEDARKCYSKPGFEFSRDKFVEMLVLDGCFIVELIRKYKFDVLRDDDDDTMIINQSKQLCRDLMLLENQVPFFVLDRLFSMTRTENSKDDFLYLFQCFINDNAVWPVVCKQPIGEVSMKNVDHLLGLVHRILGSDLVHRIPGPVSEKKYGRMFRCDELQKEGIKFDKCKKSHFLDIKFVRGALIIPHFAASHETESIFKNLIIYEQFLGDAHPRYITDYVVFMNCLMKTRRDADILFRKRIIPSLRNSNYNWDYMVYFMVTRLHREITLFSYINWDYTVYNMVLSDREIASPSQSKSSIYGDVYEKVFKYLGTRGACRCM